MRENLPDVLTNMVREPQAAQSTLHLTGLWPNLCMCVSYRERQRIRERECLCV